MFLAKIAEEKMKRKDIYFFGFGALLSTFLFLTIIAVTGNFTREFLSKNTIKVLNMIVGLVLIYFGCKMATRRTH